MRAPNFGSSSLSLVCCPYTPAENNIIGAIRNYVDILSKICFEHCNGFFITLLSPESWSKMSRDVFLTFDIFTSFLKRFSQKGIIFLRYNPCQISLWTAFFHCCNKVWSLLALPFPWNSNSKWLSQSSSSNHKRRQRLFVSNRVFGIENFPYHWAGRLGHIALESFLNYHSSASFLTDQKAWRLKERSCENRNSWK